MALTGFDPSKVESSINAVKSAYSDLIRALGDESKSKFVNGMATIWACRDAQKFFNDQYKPAMENLIKTSSRIFQSVVDVMNQAARAWASDTKSDYNNKSFSPINKAVDVSNIKENIGGVRGIDLQSAGSVTSQLQVVAQSAEDALSKARQAVDSCGFVGGNQAAQLQSSLNTIKSNISSATNKLSSSVKEAIDKTVSTYQDTEGKISQAFSGN